MVTVTGQEPYCLSNPAECSERWKDLLTEGRELVKLLPARMIYSDSLMLGFAPGCFQDVRKETQSPSVLIQGFKHLSTVVAQQANRSIRYQTLSS